ncbi:hypothetical protein [Roseobacter sp. HKCCA0434]|uniref:hypothetical protein n=1 Tax=Roseobacter sp. HKCCA0434 TaxID=3079297 RepID=UPI002905EF78|nr:hypothetical protein [Roseobacter sp. HKCCA0434]
MPSLATTSPAQTDPGSLSRAEFDGFLAVYRSWFSDIATRETETLRALGPHARADLSSAACLAAVPARGIPGADRFVVDAVQQFAKAPVVNLRASGFDRPVAEGSAFSVLDLSKVRARVLRAVRNTRDVTRPPHPDGPDTMTRDEYDAFAAVWAHYHRQDFDLRAGASLLPPPPAYDPSGQNARLFAVLEVLGEGIYGHLSPGNPVRIERDVVTRAISGRSLADLRAVRDRLSRRRSDRRTQS